MARSDSAQSSSSSSSRSSSSFDLYQVVTQQIIDKLEAGVAPWRSPILGRQSAGFPVNLVSGKRYRGVNVFLLAMTAWAQGYESSHWLTFNQARERGGSVRKGEKSSIVVFWKQYKTTDKQTGKEINIPVLRYFNVWNLCQCDGITAPDAPTYTPSTFEPSEAAQAIVRGFTDGPAIVHGGSQAFYRPPLDEIHIPEPTRFATTDEYYSTLYHEMVHATGTQKRLNRGLDSGPRPFGSPDYSKEELIAEMGAAFLTAEAGIAPGVIDNQTAYLQGWLKVLKGDKRLIVIAAGAAQKAADWILGQRQPTDKSDESPG
jgi:antirestriction protein ArdC